MTRAAPLRHRAFSILELLCVVAVMTLIAGLSLPAFLRSMQASNLSAGAQMIADQLNFARQSAITRNRPIEVRFYKIADFNEGATPEVFRALQLFTIGPDGTTPLSRPGFLENPVYFLSDDVQSPLLTRKPLVEGATTTVQLANYGSHYQYATLTYRPDGSTDLAPGGNFLTLALRHDRSASAGGNFATLQIDPVDGRVRTYRP